MRGKKFFLACLLLLLAALLVPSCSSSVAMGVCASSSSDEMRGNSSRSSGEPKMVAEREKEQRIAELENEVLRLRQQLSNSSPSASATAKPQTAAVVHLSLALPCSIFFPHSR